MTNELKELIKRMQSFAQQLAQENNEEGFANLDETELYEKFDFIQMRIHQWAQELEKIAATE